MAISKMPRLVGREAVSQVVVVADVAETGWVELPRVVAGDHVCHELPHGVGCGEDGLAEVGEHDRGLGEGGVGGDEPAVSLAPDQQQVLVRAFGAAVRAGEVGGGWRVGVTPSGLDRHVHGHGDRPQITVEPGRGQVMAHRTMDYPADAGLNHRSCGAFAEW